MSRKKMNEVFGRTDLVRKFQDAAHRVSAGTQDMSEEEIEKLAVKAVKRVRNKH